PKPSRWPPYPPLGRGRGSPPATSSVANVAEIDLHDAELRLALDQVVRPVPREKLLSVHRDPGARGIVRGGHVRMSRVEGEPGARAGDAAGGQRIVDRSRAE